MTRSLAIELALLGLLSILWGSSYLLIAVSVETIPPLTTAAARVTIAAVFLCAVVHLRRERLPTDGRTWRMLLIQAVLNSIGAWTVLAWGQQFIPSGVAGVLNSTSPLFVVLATLIFLSGTGMTPRKIAGALIGLLGVALIVGVEALAGLGQEVLAQLAVLSGAAMYAGAAIYGRRFADLPATVTAAGTMIWASVWLVPIAAVVEQPWTAAPSAHSLAAIAVLGLACTGIAMTLYFRLIRTLGSLGAASQAYLRAGVSVVLGVVILGETLTPVVAAGLAIAILGVVLINMPSRSR